MEGGKGGSIGSRVGDAALESEGSESASSIGDMRPNEGERTCGLSSQLPSGPVHVQNSYFAASTLWHCVRITWSSLHL